MLFCETIKMAIKLLKIIFLGKNDKSYSLSMNKKNACLKINKNNIQSFLAFSVTTPINKFGSENSAIIFLTFSNYY